MGTLDAKLIAKSKALVILDKIDELRALLDANGMVNADSLNDLTDDLELTAIDADRTWQIEQVKNKHA